MKQKLLYFLSFFVVSFLFFSFNVSGISHANDIHFSWVSPLIYNEVNPRDFTIDNNTLSLTYYNNSDYFEHTYSLNNFSYNNGSYYENIVYFFEGAPALPDSIMYHNDNYYVFDREPTAPINVYNDSLELIDTTYHSNMINTLCSVIYTGVSDSNYVYLLGYNTDISPSIAYLIRCSYNFTYIDTLFSLENTGTYYSMYDMTYFNNSLYIVSVALPSDITTMLRYDLEGNLIDSYNIEVSVEEPFTCCYYQSLFYVYDMIDDNIHIYDTSFTLTDELVRSDNMYYDIYIHRDLVFWIQDTTHYTYIYNMSFEANDYYYRTEYFPNDNGLFDSVNNLNVNLTHQTHSFGYYNATYSFENDTVGGVPNNWTDISGVDCSVVVNDTIDYHKDVLHIYDGSVVNYPYIYTEFNATIGIIEYWYQVSDATKNFFSEIFNELTQRCFTLRTFSNSFWYVSGGWVDLGINCNSNQWYHIRMDFNCTSDTLNLYINNTIVLNGTNFENVATTMNQFRFKGHTNTGSKYAYADAVGFTWLTDYELNQNLQYGIEYNSFHNEIVFLNESFNEILSIECQNGDYYVNDVNTFYNVFFNASDYVYDIWSLNISINQIFENGTIQFYNESNSLLHIENFTSLSEGNIKYFKYIQYFQNSSHFINTTNFYVYSNNTMICGNNGFLSYELDLIDTTEWIIDSNTVLNITGYGMYRLYVSNDTYENGSSILYQLTNWIFLDNEVSFINIAHLDCSIENPYLIVETINGLYLFDKILITSIADNVILQDSRGYVYEDVFTHSNVNTTFSRFYVNDNNFLVFEIIFDENNLEYMQLSFNIENIVNENYRILCDTYLNTSESNLIAQMNLKHTDATEMKLDMEYLYNSEIEILEQDKITSYINFYVSDDNLLNNENITISGYIEGFTFNYSETIIFSIFVDNMLIMLIPIIIIMVLTTSLSYMFRDQKKKEKYNKSMFFPIFIISAIIVFVLGFYDTWILFIIIISAFVYLIKKRDDYK